jgi:hypothetical protein
MGLTYAQYLRMCRDIYGAEIVGKGEKYPYPVFKFSKELEDLIEQLNARANLVLWEREHPDWREHQEYLAQKEKEKQARKEAAKNVSNS